MTTSTQAKPRITLWTQDPIAEFIQHITAKRYAKKTVRNYAFDLYKIQRELGYPLYLVTSEALANYLEKLATTDLKTATIQRKQVSLRVFFKWALKHHYVKEDPAQDFERLKKPKRLPVHLEPDQVEAMFGALREDTRIDLRESAMMQTLYYTGLRAGELVELNVASWDRRTGYLRVIGKGDKERMVPVPKALAEVLGRWLEVRPDVQGPMFTTLGLDPGRMKYDTFRRIFHRIMRRAGLHGLGFHPHSLRHTYATRLLREGVSIDKIQKLLGHEDISTTSLYAHTNIDSDTIAALDRIL